MIKQPKGENPDKAIHELHRGNVDVWREASEVFQIKPVSKASAGVWHTRILSTQPTALKPY